MNPAAPPRPELLALLDAVKDHPDDDTPRLVLADWLDEQDNELDAERAAFIRGSIADSRAGPPQNIPSTTEQNANRYGQRVLPGSEEGRAAEAERAATDERLRRWLGRLGSTAYGGRFYRGLPVLIVPGTWFLRPEVTPLLATEAFAFVQFVQLAEVGGSRMTVLAGLPEFRFVPGVSADPFTALGTHYAAKFFGSAHLTGLRQIDFRGIDPGAVGVQALATNPALARLRKLALVHNKLVDKAVAALAASPHLANLTHLNLSDNNIGDKGAEALAAAKSLANLGELNLTLNPRLTEAGKQLLREKFADRVRL